MGHFRNVLETFPSWVGAAVLPLGHSVGEQPGHADSMAAAGNVPALFDLMLCVCPRSRSSSMSMGSTAPQTWFLRAQRARDPVRLCLQIPTRLSRPAQHTHTRDQGLLQVSRGSWLGSGLGGRWMKTLEGFAGAWPIRLCSTTSWLCSSYRQNRSTTGVP